MPRRARLILGVLAALLLLATGFAAGTVVPILRTPDDHSVDAGFARDMSQHHGQAVEMSMLAYQKGAESDIRTLGYDMATTQQYQVGMMQSWLVEWNLSPTGTDRPMAWMPDGRDALLPDGRMPGMATKEELAKLSSSTGKDFDTFWCQLMLRHHLGGIHMSEEATKRAAKPYVREVAEQIRVSQLKEVTVLQAQLKELGAEPIS